jgi:RNA-directed DNA polymerase
MRPNRSVSSAAIASDIYSESGGPLGIAALEDKIGGGDPDADLWAEFLGFSYGFRPNRNQHQAPDALAFGIGRQRINWVLDCDVQSFFDKLIG